MPNLRKRKILNKPFVVTLAPLATSLLAPGCFVEATSNPPALICPSAMPSGGAECTGALDCDYGVDSCGIAQTASCVNGAWQTSGPVACNPPPPDPQCPTDLPTLGGTCNWMWQAGFGCTYTIDIGCGPQSISAMCNGTTVTVEYTAPACGKCSSLTTESTCSTDAGCRWLTPGCGTVPLAMAGCFPVADCTGNAECTTAGQTCQDVSYNPCYGKSCDACGAQAKLCLAAPPPQP